MLDGHGRAEVHFELGDDHLHVAGPARRLEHLDGVGALARSDAIGSVIDRETDGRREVDDGGRTIHREVERRGIEDGSLDERRVDIARVVLATGRELVEREDGVPTRLKLPTQVGAGESGTAGEEHIHSGQGYKRAGRALRVASVPPVSRLFLSPPDVGRIERALLLEAFGSNWIAPLGPMVDAFEREFAEYVGVPHAAALSSGTAALHLALMMLGVGPGDDVLVPTLTFVASANAVTYVGARPVFVDSDEATWNLDPQLVAEELEERARDGRLPAAVIAVDLYGQCCEYGPLLAACEQHGVPVIEDAAEALGATCGGRAAGAFGRFGVFSFNGNKIITTSGGGMLVSDDADAIDRVRYLSTQARDPAPHYEHSVTGFNYRMSNLLAAVGRGQLQGLKAKVARRRAIKTAYREAFANVSGIGFMPDFPGGKPTNWLTVVTIDQAAFGASPTAVREHLESLDIEARPAWKPMHLQPLFAGFPCRGGMVAERIFEAGLCLPSGSSMSDVDVARVVNAVLGAR